MSQIPRLAAERVKRMGTQLYTMECNRMRVQLSVGDGHKKLVVEEELEVSL
jgi:hypothetical protein